MSKFDQFLGKGPNGDPFVPQKPHFEIILSADMRTVLIHLDFIIQEHRLDGPTCRGVNKIKKRGRYELTAIIGKMFEPEEVLVDIVLTIMIAAQEQYEDYCTNETRSSLMPTARKMAAEIVMNAQRELKESHRLPFENEPEPEPIDIDIDREAARLAAIRLQVRDENEQMRLDTLETLMDDLEMEEAPRGALITRFNEMNEVMAQEAEEIRRAQEEESDADELRRRRNSMTPDDEVRPRGFDPDFFPPEGYF